MRYDPDEFSSHAYEVKNLYMEGSSFKTVFFYLHAGESVNIKIDGVLRRTNLWMEPTESEPKREYHVFLEIKPRDSMGTVDLYMSKVTVEWKEDNA